MGIGNGANVGIGTIAPLKLLHVSEGSSGATLRANAKVFIEIITYIFYKCNLAQFAHTAILDFIFKTLILSRKKHIFWVTLMTFEY